MWPLSAGQPWGIIVKCAAHFVFVAAPASKPPSTQKSVVREWCQSTETTSVPLTASLTLCQYCNHANPVDANFCIGCGAQLHLVPCPACGAVNPKTSKTCYQCHGELRESTEILLARVPATESEVEAANAASTAMSTTYTAQPATPQRQPIYVIVIILLAFASAGYFAYLQRSTVAEKPNTTEGRTKNASDKALATSPANTSAGTINKGPIDATPPAPSITAPVPLAAPVAAAINPPSERATVPGGTKSTSTVDSRDPARPAIATPSLAPRQASRQQAVPPSVDSRGTKKEVPQLGTCTEGVAALGLCTPGPTKGNQ